MIGGRTRRGSIESGRGQSDVIGSLLVALILVVVLSAVGIQLLSILQVEATPRVDIRPTVNATHVVLVHEGGDTVDRGDVRVTLRNETGASTRFSLEAATIENGDDDAEFEVGERAVHTHDLTGIVQVIVAHDPTGETLLDDREAVP